MKKFYTIFLLAVMMNAAGALSQVPKTMSFQGLLVTPSTGNPVADGTYSFLFNLYDISTGGSPLWFEIQSSVNVSGGLYNVVLGSVKPFDVPFNKPYFLEVVVGGTTLSPRIELTSSAYLLNSHILDLSDGTLTGSKIGKGIQADSITSGILPLGRLSGITSAQLNPAAGITSDQITSLDASKLTGTINSSNFDASLADLSDGLLSGSRLDTGINASNITRGTLSLARLSGITHTELNASAGITNAQIASLDASKLTGTLPLGRLSGITSSELDAAAGITSGQIASLDAAKLTGTVPLAQLSGIKSSQLDAAAGITSSQINSLDASKLTGTVPLLRLSGITGSQLSASAGITGSQLSGTAGIVSGQITSLDGAKLTGTLGAVNGSAITNLNADNLSSGTVPLAQLSGITSTQLSASAGITSGQITSLDAAKLTGTLAAVNGSAVTSLNAGNLSSGTVPLAQLSGITATQLSATAGITSGQITSLDAAKLTGTLAAINGSAVTSLNAGNLSSGTVPLAQLSGITSSQLSASAGITSGQISSLDAGKLTGTLAAVNGSALTSLNAGNLASGIVPLGRLSGITTSQLSASAGILDAQIAGISGSKVGSGINASNITTGTLSGTLVGSGINGANITAGTVADAAIASVSASKVSGITSGYVARGTGSALTTGALRDDGTQVGIGSAPTTGNKLYVYTSTNGKAGYFVDNYSTNTVNYGIWTEAVGTSEGYGIWAYGHGGATDNVGAYGNAVGAAAGGNYGVYGSTTSTNGSGVNYAVYGIANGGVGNYGGYFANLSAIGTGIGVESASPSLVTFFNGSHTSIGGISYSGGTVTYSAFTGSHLASIRGQVPERGKLISMTGNLTNPDEVDAEPVYITQTTNKPDDPQVLGSYFSGAGDHSGNHYIQAVGNGEMWVVDNGCDLKAGDALISSGVTGHAMKDNGVFDIAYVVARVSEDIHWNEVTDTVNGLKHKRVSVLFDNFVINHKADRLENQVVQLKNQNQEIKAEMEVLSKRLAEIEKYLNTNASGK